MIKSFVHRCLSASLLSASLLLGVNQTVSAQETCWLSFPPGGNTASLNIYNPWANGTSVGNTNANHNPAYFIDSVTVGNSVVSPGSYLGWCLDFNDYINTTPTLYSTLMFSSCDTNLNLELEALGLGYPSSVYVDAQTWNEINYILNHKNGSYFNDIQIAIWALIGGPGSLDAIYAEVPPPPQSQNPPFNKAAINAILHDATNNAANWTPQCGDVIGVVVVIPHGNFDPVQLTMIEVPYPCVPCVSVSKEIACLQPGSVCSDFAKVASGLAGVGCNGVNEPAFCYKIALTNCGTVPLTNIIVSDNLLGVLSTNFFTNGILTLLPGQSANAIFSMSFPTNATNTVTVYGQAALNVPVLTNSDSMVVTNGEIVMAADSATALVDTASVSCSLQLFAPNAVSGNGDNALVLPAAAYASSNSVVNMSVHICNTGVAELTNLTINVPALANFTCTPPGAFSLAPGACQDFQLCMAAVSCPAQMNFNITVTGQVAPDTNHCSVLDLNNSPISVCSACSGSISCSTNSGCLSGTANVSGTVFMHCSYTNTNTLGDSALSGVTVTLLNAANVPLGSTLTDSNGNYSFTSLGAGLYYIQVTPPAGYVETYPAGVTNGTIPVIIVVCQDVTGVNFGFANTTPPNISVTPGGSLGCNPITFPTDDSMATNVTAVVNCGAATTNITHVDTNNGCSYSRVFTIVVSDSLGNSATNYATYTWTLATLTFSNVPPSGPLGCNPASLPTDQTISNLVSLSDSCSVASFTVSHQDTTTNCSVTRVFTISALDACSDTAVAYVTNTWTLATLSFASIPTGGPLGCNPASLPDDSSVSNAVTISDNCSTVTFAVTHNDTVSGCSVTRVFTVSASDSCNDTATAYVTNIWTVATLSFASVPTGGPLGCNPASLPSDSSISNAVSISDSCSTATFAVTHNDTTSGCSVTRVFTISASDSCNDAAIAYVTNTWTVATLTFSNVPTGGPLGCNPASLPTDSSISNAVTLSDSCSTATFSVTHNDTTAGCSVTRVFAISASDSCNDTAMAYVTNTWTVATLSFASVPTGGPLGCNPASLPTDSSVSNAVTLTDTCSATTFSVTHNDTTSGCAVTRVFTISASDSCSDSAVAYVTNTWTVASLTFSNVPAGGPLGCNPLSIPSDVTVSNAVKILDSCSAVTASVTHQDSTIGCTVTRVFTISASDACGDSAVARVTNTWTVASLTFGNVPPGGPLGCNPATIPTDSSISNLVVLVDTCSAAGFTVTHNDNNTGCAITRVFTIAASDACGDTAVAYVTNSWTTDVSGPSLSGIPTGTNFGCNPTNIPATSNLMAQIKISDSCSAAGFTVTGNVTTNGCAVTQIFTITATNACGYATNLYVTNTWTADTTAPTLSGVPANQNLGCNPAGIPTVASVQATVKAADTCTSNAAVSVTASQSTNGCSVTQIFKIVAIDNCSNSTTAYVTNTWNADVTPPIISGVPSGKNLGCNPTNIPTLASIQAMVSASDTCSPASVKVTGNATTNGCGVTQVFTIIATNACGSAATAYVTNSWLSVPTLYLTNVTYITNTVLTTNTYFLTNSTIKTNVTTTTNITISTNCCTNSICGNFNWSNPGNGWLWLNSHCTAYPGKDCVVYCSNASVTLACNNGKSYVVNIPDCDVTYSSSCTTATNWFDGTKWHTKLPCAGDDQTFLQGCPIPWNNDYANCQSVCWTAVFSCTTPGFTCGWQWGAACYNNSSTPSCGSIAPKASHNYNCQSGNYYSGSDYAGAPENYKPWCVSGGTGYGSGNCTGSWSPSGTLCAFGTKTNKVVTNIVTYTTNVVVTTNTSTSSGKVITTNVTVSTTTAGPILSGVPTGMNFGCNPANPPTPASVQAQIVASSACSTVNVTVTGVNTTNGCSVVQLLTISAANACGGATTAYVTNTWTSDHMAPVITGLGSNTFLGCSSLTLLPGDSNILSCLKATDQCGGGASVSVTHVDTTNGCTGLRTFTITATDACGNVTLTNLVYTWTGHSPDYCTNVICYSFNSQNPGSGWVWLNAHCSGNPGKDVTLYCQNATVTFTCNNGKKYTYPVPDGQVNFRSACTTATNWFDGTQWNTTLPANGDDEIFLQGCAIPWNSDFTSCHNVCWTGVFYSDTPGQSFNWQFGAACYANSKPTDYTTICPKACHTTACTSGTYYKWNDHAGCPENPKPYCVGGGTGSGGTNCTGSWSGTDTTCTFTAGTSLPPVLNGVPADDDLGVNPTNIPTISNILALVTATDTCSPAPVHVIMSVSTNVCDVTQIFTITATNDCGNYAIDWVTNTWSTMPLTKHCVSTICTSFNASNPGNGWLWFNAQCSGKPGSKEVYLVCSNASVTLTCLNGKTYTYPVPCGAVQFTKSCTTATNWFDGTNWNTTLPTNGDDQIFFTGCPIPWNNDFAGCKSVCWTADYYCNSSGLSFNWQFGAACYNNQIPDCKSLAPKSCHQTTCYGGYYFNQGHNAGVPENHNPYCVGGGTGYGGSNCNGNFSNPGTCRF